MESRWPGTLSFMICVACSPDNFKLCIHLLSLHKTSPTQLTVKCSEPCIRGHRSTKCTHASERLMVPVRKPGRPLSQCPHPRDQSCGCGTVVTAAIPRKQTCGCGTSKAAENSTTTASSQSSSPLSQPQTTTTTPIEAPSPTRNNFKIQKPVRPQSSRKPSFDVTNLERMDMSQINVVPFQQQQAPPIGPSPLPNYGFPNYPPAFGYIPQFATMQPQIGHYQMPPPLLPMGYEPMVALPAMMNGYSNGIHPQLAELAIESPLATPTVEETKILSPTNGNTNGVSSCCQPKTTPKPAVSIPPLPKKAGSCCSSKNDAPSKEVITSPISESIPEEPITSSCCSSKNKPPAMKHEPMSAASTPMMQPQMLFPNGMPLNPSMYTPYFTQPTIFTYPPTYGSFQNPLQPNAWRESMRQNDFVHQQQMVAQQPGAIAYEAPLIPGTLNTIHECLCGNGCSCIGCAAHPYNDETKEYIRSAWDAMNLDAQPELYANTSGHHHVESSTLNGAMSQNHEYAGSPTANTPSSTTSANGEESLNAADFFFVSYPFAGDGCGGDSASCLCGESCECLG